MDMKTPRKPVKWFKLVSKSSKCKLLIHSWSVNYGRSVVVFGYKCFLNEQIRPRRYNWYNVDSAVKYSREYSPN
jgi:hypothetical protein